MVKVIRFVIYMYVSLTSIKMNGVWGGLKADGEKCYSLGIRSLSSKEYVDGVLYFWASLLFTDKSSSYKANDAYEKVFECFRKQEGLTEADGFAFVGYEYSIRKEEPERMKMYLDHVVKLDPNNRIMSLIRYEEEKKNDIIKEFKNAETLYNKGNQAFSDKELKQAVKYFEDSCEESKG